MRFSLSVDNCWGRLLLIAFAASCFAARAAKADTNPSDPADSRYGPLGLLDRRSVYAQSWFPEPLRAPEMDVEREIRFDYLHGEGEHRQVSSVTAEIEYSFGLLTVEMAVPYERESEAALDPLTRRVGHSTTEGIGSIELAARHPVFQYVSPGNAFDYTLGCGLEVAIPKFSEISHDTEVVPQVFQLLGVGEHFSVQASAAYSALIGPAEGGTDTLEYNLVLGYNLEREQLPLPGVLAAVPIFELNGERALSGGSAGQNQLFGAAGFRLNFESVGPAQPRIGLGYVFPIDRGARAELGWGIVTSLVFEF